jgi:hypothetical protein
MGTFPPWERNTSFPKYQHTAENGEKPFPVHVVWGEGTAHGMPLENVVCLMCGKSLAAAHSSVALISCPRPNAMLLQI